MREEMTRYYESDRECPNLLSKWYPKVKDAPGFFSPRTITIPVPIEVFQLFADDAIETGKNIIADFVKNEIQPRMQTSTWWFIKNGCFSNKFDFAHTITNERKVLDDFVEIQYASACLETSGMSEINLREVIWHRKEKTATIYNGMPLRTEIRVFYDFDKRKVLYSANYWDYDYCRKGMTNRTDQIVFDALKDEIAAGYEKHREQVERAVADAMRGVDMTGKWSVDVLIEEGTTATGETREHENGTVEIVHAPYAKFWLIDMAEAQRSAYWKGGLFDK